MFQKLKSHFKKNLKNIQGWRTDRKIVVIESDDWGSVRMPSKNSLNRLSAKGLRVENCHYMMNDSLASIEDLNLLFSILSKHKSESDTKPVITANTIVANPDFKAIREDNWSKYYYNDLISTFKNFNVDTHSLEYWHVGMNEGVFRPQFHGREHIQVERWMNYLQKEDPETIIAFNENVYGVSTSVTNNSRQSFMAAFDFDTKEELSNVCKIVDEGLKIFEKIFGFKSLTSIAPNYTWNHDVEMTLMRNGVKYLQGGQVQRIPNFHNQSKEYSRHFMGQKNQLNQIYLIRNCSFEPSSNPSKNWLESCLSEISIAFRWNKPAIIESHRVNYVGFINSSNRNKNLELLDTLLQKIIERWPDVEFMSSDQLGDFIENSN